MSEVAKPSHRQRRKLVAVITIYACALGVLTPLAPRVWRWATLERIEGDHGQGDKIVWCVKRWGPNAGKMHGPFVWWKQGTKVEEATFRNGELHGIVTQWSVVGVPKEQRRYARGELVETRVEPPWLTDLVSPMPSGVHWEWHPGERYEQLIDTERTFVDGCLHGTVTEWANTGEIYEQLLYENGVEVDAREEAPWWSEKADQRYYQNGQRVASGLLDDDGERVGVWTIWSPRDPTRVLFQVMYNDGLKANGRHEAPWWTVVGD